MNRQIKYFVAFIFLNVILLNAQSLTVKSIIDKTFNTSTLLWYDKPAAKWEDAIPVGNGRLGAMIFGKTDEERVQINEDTYWSGGPYSTVVKGGAKMLPEIQKLVFEGKIFEANKLFGRYIMGYPVEQQKYQSLADIVLFSDHKNVKDYKRWLDLQTGIAGVEYVFNGIRYKREVIASAPDQIIIIRITADKPGSINLKVNLRGVRNQAHSNYGTDYFRMDSHMNNQLILTGKSADYLGIAGKLRFEARLKAVNEGGIVKTDYENLYVEKADAVTFLFYCRNQFC